MKQALLAGCLAVAHGLLWTGTSHAESIESARVAYADGRFAEASELAAVLGTSEGLAFAAETLAIHGFYVAEESEQQALFQRAMGYAEEAIALDDSNPEAHLQLSHAMGRYAQTLGAMKAVREGVASKVRDAMERAVELAPDLGRAHLSLASWHAEAVRSGGVMARMLYGASKKRAEEHYERAFALAPDDKAVQTEYATGLMLINTRKNRAAARELLQRAVETPPHDAYERILQEQAVEQLAALDGS